MNEGQALGLIAGVAMLVLAVSALASRRVSPLLVLKGVIGWIAIFALLFLLLQIDWIRDLIPAANRDRPPVGKDMVLIPSDNSEPTVILHNVYYRSDVDLGVSPA